MHEAVCFERVSKRYRLREGETLKEFLSSVLLHRQAEAPFYALRDLTMSIAAGESVGIIGPNGSGKSTILRLIAGVSHPSEGYVYTNGRIAPLIELGAGFHPDLTGRENVLINGCILGLTNRQIWAAFDEIVGFAEMEQFVDTPVKHYSSGMYLRLAFSIAVHSQPDVLLVDEALAVGDLAFRQKCLERIREFQSRGVTIVLVSHSLDLVRDFCDRALLLHAGQITAEGDPTTVIDRYQEMVGSLTHTTSSAG